MSDGRYIDVDKCLTPKVMAEPQTLRSDERDYNPGRGVIAQA